MIKIETQLEAGKILIAKTCAWNREEYTRSVIFLLNHNEDGSTGIILNKMSNLSVRDALPEIPYDAPLYFGGNNNMKTISYFHRNKNIPDAFSFTNGVYWGGNYDYIQNEAYNNTIDFNNFMFYAGFVVWNSGQLLDEMYSNKWYLESIHPSEMFNVDISKLWGDKLYRMEKPTGLFLNYPEPSFN